MLVELLHVGVVLEVVGCLGHDKLYPRGQTVEGGGEEVVVEPDGVGVGRGVILDAGEESPRTQDVVEVVRHEFREEFVALLKDFDGFFGQPDVDRRLVLSVHDGRALLVVDVGILVADLHEAVPKLVEFVVERCAADLLLCVVELDADVALLDDDGLREVLVVHEDAGDVGAIYFAAEGELTVYDVAGVEVGQVAVLCHLQIELLAVKVRHVGGTLYVVGAGTGGERQECGNSIDDLVHNMFDHLAEAVSATDPFRFRY